MRLRQLSTWLAPCTHTWSDVGSVGSVLQCPGCARRKLAFVAIRYSERKYKSRDASTCVPSLMQDSILLDARMSHPAGMHNSSKNNAEQRMLTGETAVTSAFLVPNKYHVVASANRVTLKMTVRLPAFGHHIAVSIAIHVTAVRLLRHHFFFTYLPMHLVRRAPDSRAVGMRIMSSDGFFERVGGCNVI
jgi:hypothetical protein